MSIAAMGWAWKRPSLTSTEKFVLIALADNADDDGICWPGQKYLSEKTSLSRETINRAIAKLGERGLLEVIRRKDSVGRPLSSRYMLRCGGNVTDDHIPYVTDDHSMVTDDHTNLQLESSVREPKSKQSRIKSRIPANFTLSPEMLAYAMQQGVALPEVEFRKFREYYEAKGSAWLDWVKVWQRWCRNNRESYANQNGAVSPYGPPRPREFVAPISQEQRLENVRRLRELTAGIGK